MLCVLVLERLRTEAIRKVSFGIGSRICLRLDLTYKCEKMVEMAMLLSQKNLPELLVFNSRIICKFSYSVR